MGSSNDDYKWLETKMVTTYCGKYTITSSYAGYNSLALLYKNIKKHEIDAVTGQRRIKIPDWFQGNLCAPFGVIIRQLQFAKYEHLQLQTSRSIDELFNKNGFYKIMIREPKLVEDKYHTTIPYSEFRCDDADHFNNYLDFQLTRDKLPAMTNNLWEKFTEALNELYVNASVHSETNWIMACGQSFPQIGKMDFSIADAGIGFRARLVESGVFPEPKNKEQLDEQSINAIEWALQKGHSTKPESGGFGLTLLRAFVALNKGKLQIASDTGYWEYNSGHDRHSNLQCAFPGTAINLEINTDDDATYCLWDEE